MVDRSILFVHLGGGAHALASHLCAAGWEVVQAADLAAAARMQARRSFPIVLLLLGDCVPEGAEEAMEACIKAAQEAEWVIVCGEQALGSADLRDLVLGRRLGCLVLPLDWPALAVLLTHAQHRASLRQSLQQRGRAQAADALGMVGQGQAITRLRTQICKVAATAAPVLIGGESGSGKELAARAIHRHSGCAAGPFVEVNCGAIAPSLIHSELFGHERGAFTGASSQRVGLIESANGGTLFLDEIGDLPLDLQASLLRFLQEKTIHRVGGVQRLAVNVRVVAASHVDLGQAVRAGRFREDLFYRLNVLAIEVPPLRRRMEDVPALAEHFLQCCIAQGQTRVEGFRRQAIAAMQAHDWPGNVRELSNRVWRAAVMSDEHLVGPQDLGLAAPAATEVLGLDAARTTAERDVVCAALARKGRNVTLAARELGVSRMTLYRLMEKHHIALCVQ